MFEPLVSLIKHFAERLTRFVFCLEEERQPGELEQMIKWVLEVVANLALMAMVLSLTVRAAWQGLSTPEAKGMVQAIDVGWALQHFRELTILALVSLLVVIAALTLLFWLRHVLSPSRLLTMFAIYEVGKVCVRLWTSESTWTDVLGKLVG